MAMPAAPLTTSVRRVAVVCPAGEPLHQLTTSVFGEILNRQHRILAIAPSFSDAQVRSLDDMGAERAQYAAEGFGLKLLADWKAIGEVKSLFAEWSPHTVLACGRRAMIYAALAAK